MKRPATLTSKQRRQLRALAHDLSPLVVVGKEGITDSLRDAVDEALTQHELIKVRVLESAPIDRGAAAEDLAAKLDAHAIGEIGRIVILYRRHPSEPVVPLRG